MEFVTKINFRIVCPSCGKAIRNDWTPDKPYQYGKTLPRNEKDGVPICSFCGAPNPLEVVTDINFNSVCDKCGVAIPLEFKNIGEVKPGMPYAYGMPLPVPATDVQENGITVTRKFCPYCKHVGEVVEPPK